MALSGAPSIFPRKVYTQLCQQSTIWSKPPEVGGSYGIAVSLSLALWGDGRTNDSKWIASSRGRGTRAACWFSDYLEEKGDTNTQSLILLEGLKGWAKGGAEYVECIDGYDHAYWESQ